MNNFGSVLRGLGSVLNPQVAQELAAEDRDEAATRRQLQMFALQQRMQQQTPEYQAKLEALKNEKLFREEVAGAGGDMSKVAAAAVKYGKPEIAASIYNQHEARAARAQQAAEALEARKLQLQQNHELALQRITDGQARQAEVERHNREMEAARARSDALQAEVAKGNQELKRMQFQMKGDRDLVTNTQRLGAALEKANLPQADAVLGDVEEALKKNPNISEYISGPKSNVPDWLAPDTAKFGRQAFQKLFNITLKDRSGAAVTNQELERLKAEFAAGTFKTGKQLNEAVQKARGIINSHYRSVAAGFGPEPLKAYNENIRGFGGRVVLDAEPKEDPLGIR